MKLLHRPCPCCEWGICRVEYPPLLFTDSPEMQIQLRWRNSLNIPPLDLCNKQVTFLSPPHRQEWLDQAENIYICKYSDFFMYWGVNFYAISWRCFEFTLRKALPNLISNFPELETAAKRISRRRRNGKPITIKGISEDLHAEGFTTKSGGALSTKTVWTILNTRRKFSQAAEMEQVKV